MKYTITFCLNGNYNCIEMEGIFNALSFFRHLVITNEGLSECYVYPSENAYNVRYAIAQYKYSSKNPV